MTARQVFQLGPAKKGASSFELAIASATLMIARFMRRPRRARRARALQLQSARRSRPTLIRPRAYAAANRASALLIICEGCLRFFDKDEVAPASLRPG